MPNYFDAEDGHDIVAHLRDGRVMAMGRYSEVLSSGTNNVVIRIPDLKYIEYVIQVEFYSDPDTKFDDHAFMDKKITGNLVGMTLYGLNAATTLTVEVIAVGPP